MIPPKPAARPRRVPFWRYVRLFRQDMLSSHPAHLYRAQMAEYRAPFFRSVLVNDPAVIRTVLRERPQDFPKSMRVAEGLRPLLGGSVFLTNGATWARQRRIIDPAFEGGRLREVFPAIEAAAGAAADRLRPGEVEVEAIAAHATADVIFRALFSVPIEDAQAAEVFAAFRAYQRAQPLLNLGAFLPLPRWLPHWLPRGHGRAAREAAAAIRRVIGAMTEARMAAIRAGTAPGDLATRIMATPDPEDGRTFSAAEMADQVAIFFLAGHETSASALAWALYLLACDPAAQDRVRAEARAYLADPGLPSLSKLGFTRDVMRETLRLYPPVPMMVRETTRAETFRGRVLRPGTQVVISPWHLHRSERHWPDPDAFRPDRWRGEAAGEAYLPFSAGQRVCPGAGFAMGEAVVLLAHIIARVRLSPVAERGPEPVAFLTVRSRDGIWLRLDPV